MPKNVEGETSSLRLTVSRTLAGYLSNLAKQGSHLGASSNDIAVRLLTNEVDRLIREGEHDRRIPTREPENS